MSRPPAAAPVESEGERERIIVKALVMRVIDACALAEGWENYQATDWSPKGIPEMIDRALESLARLRSQESEPSVRDFLAWLKGRPGISWQATVNDVEYYLDSVARVTPLTEEPASEPRTQEDE